MINQMFQVLRNEEGIETLEWIAMGFIIIVTLALIVYPGTLSGGINTVIGNIVAKL